MAEMGYSPATLLCLNYLRPYGRTSKANACLHPLKISREVRSKFRLLSERRIDDLSIRVRLCRLGTVRQGRQGEIFLNERPANWK